MGESSAMIRRMVDIGVAILVLPLLSPLFVLISVAIVVESPDSPFYRGWRVGKDAKRFRMWKFRTMVAGADRLGSSITTRCDARITKVGWFLRRTKLDELPQFFNLFLGDLTLIGPRPEVPGIVEHFTPQLRQILRLKPGITGPVQLYYTVLEADTIPDDKDAEQFYIERLLERKLRLDLEYSRTRTFLSDCRVVLQTMLLVARALAHAVYR